MIIIGHRVLILVIFIVETFIHSQNTMADWQGFPPGHRDPFTQPDFQALERENQRRINEANQRRTNEANQRRTNEANQRRIQEDVHRTAVKPIRPADGGHKKSQAQRELDRQRPHEHVKTDVSNVDHDYRWGSGYNWDPDKVMSNTSPIVSMLKEELAVDEYEQAGIILGDWVYELMTDGQNILGSLGTMQLRGKGWVRTPENWDAHNSALEAAKRGDVATVIVDISTVNRNMLERLREGPSTALMPATSSMTTVQKNVPHTVADFIYGKTTTMDKLVRQNRRKDLQLRLEILDRINQHCSSGRCAN